MKKVREDLSIALMGAAAGLMSSTVIFLIYRIEAYYAYLSSIETADQFDYERGLRELWWLPPILWHMVLSVVAAFLVHRYLKHHFKSPFLVWQVVGFTAMLGWVLTVFVGFTLESIMRGHLVSLEYLLNAEKLLEFAKYASAVFACNVFYSSVINAASRQYAEHFETEVT